MLSLRWKTLRITVSIQGRAMSQLWQAWTHSQDVSE